MASHAKVRILERARTLIAEERHWCRGDLALDAGGQPVSPMDSSAKRRCALGALVAAAYEITSDPDLAHRLATTAVRPLAGATSLTHINDSKGHAAVLALFNLALAEAV